MKPFDVSNESNLPKSENTKMAAEIAALRILPPAISAALPIRRLALLDIF
ncbi:hypothetical protein [Brevibacillus nitrificans]|nr:hypothetical protein [Brevibacillus nitrificans]MDR7315852.1 hypothetical protein [Brevibacillus nitrificans]